MSYNPNADNAAPKNSPVQIWATGSIYAINDEVLFNDEFYRTLVAHTAAAAFDTDLQAGNWQPLEPHEDIKTKSAAYTMASIDRVILASVAASFTLTLPTANSANKGLKYVVKITSLGLLQTLTVACQASQLIDGSATKAMNVLNQAYTFRSTGTGFIIE